MSGLLRELIESQEFSDRLSELGYARLDEALRGVTWALSTNPEAFPIVPGFKDVRLAKTEPIEFGPSLMPRLRIWFRIDEQGQHVHLEYIEPDPTDINDGESA